MRRLLLTVFCLAALSTAAFAQDDHNDGGQVSVGYAVVTASSVALGGIPGGLVVFETFGFRSQVPALQAGVLPATMTTRIVLYASSSPQLSRNVGVAITNPGSGDALVTLTLRRSTGIVLSSKTIAVGTHRQTARFISEFFADVPEVLRDFTGTITLTSNTPVAVLGLRFLGGKFSTLPITSLSPAEEVPAIAQGIGGSTAVIMPQFAADGGWASEMIVLNNGIQPLTVRIDLFKQDGTPLVAKLNHQTGSSFLNLVIPPGGTILFSPRNALGDSDF